MVIPSHFPENPKHLWSYFHQLTQLPRPSKNEGKVREFIVSEAAKKNLVTHVDGVGNVIVYIPATRGYEDHETVIIQNHMDMVTDALPSKKINFNTDPITTLRDGDWIKAEGTTLGADNGIGCAAALAIMLEENIAHPPLELLFTIDEETGLHGAWGVEADKLKGKKLLNLDTEEWGSFYIGCAGGIDYEFTKKFEYVPAKIAGKNYKLVVGGFVGGHSGVDIHEQRGNALKFLMEWLSALPKIELREWRGGKAHNIIPRDAFALVRLENMEEALQIGEELKARWLNFLPENDQNIFVKIEESDDNFTEVMNESEAKNLMAFMLAFPHGAHKMDLATGRSLVSLSNNQAVSLLVRGQFYLQSSLRFFDRGECVSLENQIQAIAQGFGLEFTKNGEYPSWKPVKENNLLTTATKVYEELYKVPAKVTAIHAGLECGILRDKIGPIDAVSFGPTITGAHSPDERVHVPSVEKFWYLFINILKTL